MILTTVAEFLSTAEGIISLVSSLVALIGTGVGAFLAIKGWVKAFKEKDARKKWATIMEIADAAMKEAEKSGAAGADKKTMVINSVKASCKAAGIELDDFIDQLVDYIDQTIAFVNDMTKKPTKKAK